MVARCCCRGWASCGGGVCCSGGGACYGGGGGQERLCGNECATVGVGHAATKLGRVADTAVAEGHAAVAHGQAVVVGPAVPAVVECAAAAQGHDAVAVGHALVAKGPAASRPALPSAPGSRPSDGTGSDATEVSARNSVAASGGEFALLYSPVDSDVDPASRAALMADAAMPGFKLVATAAAALSALLCF